MPQHPDAPINRSAKAPLKIEYNGNVYYRLGGSNMLNSSRFHTDVRGFWLLAAFYYNAEINLVVELTCDGHITESNFQKENHTQIFEDIGDNKVYWIKKYYRNRELYETMLHKRMSFLGLKFRKYLKKINGTYCDVMKFKTSEDYAQFRLYFSEYFE